MGIWAKRMTVDIRQANKKKFASNTRDNGREIERKKNKTETKRERIKNFSLETVIRTIFCVGISSRVLLYFPVCYAPHPIVANYSFFFHFYLFCQPTEFLLMSCDNDVAFTG